MSKFPYSAEEKEMLLDILKTYPIVESKKADATTIKKKSEAWESVCNEFNASTPGRKRSVLQLKRCWDKLKRHRKKEMTTSGGPSTSASSPSILTPDIDAVDPHIAVEVKTEDDSIDSDVPYSHSDLPDDTSEKSRSPHPQTPESEPRLPSASFNRTRSIDRLMSQRFENAVDERRQIEELHQVRMAIEEEHLVQAKIETEIKRVELLIKQKQLSLL